jgi:signal transduction histidine kinase
MCWPARRMRGNMTRVPYHRISDLGRLQALLGAVLLIESDLDLEALLRRIVEEAVALADAGYGAIRVLDPKERLIEHFIHVGMGREVVERIGHLPEGRGMLGLLLDEPIRLVDLAAHPASVGFPVNHPPMKTFLGVPVRMRGAIYGNLYLTEKVGGGEFTELDVDVVETLAIAAGMAISNARLHSRVSELSVAEDRDRIARDLHDTVIQRLYGIGLSLQGTIRLVEDERARTRIQESLDEIDTTIRQIRTSIFELEAPSLPGQGLRARVLALVSESSRGLDFEPEVRFVGALDTLVGSDVAGHVLAVLREALSNVARHARARRVEIELLLEHDELHAVVSDDGSGFDRASATSGMGLTSMNERAAALGGSCVIGPRPGGGTEVRWRIPL